MCSSSYLLKIFLCQLNLQILNLYFDLLDFFLFKIPIIATYFQHDKPILLPLSLCFQLFVFKTLLQCCHSRKLKVAVHFVIVQA